MTDLTYSISNEVFDRFPGYVRGVVLLYDVTNVESPPDLVRLLRDAEAGVSGQLSLDKIAEHPRIKAWREAFRAFGAKPSEFRSSIEAMSRRALRGDLLPSINALVDIGNLLSLRHLVPTGGHSLDVLTHDIALRAATGQETFVPLGSEETESPLPGEIVFVHDNTVLTRRWTWRQAQFTLMRLETRNVEFNIDALPPVQVDEVQEIGREIVDLVQRYCGGRSRVELLSREQPRISL